MNTKIEEIIRNIEVSVKTELIALHQSVGRVLHQTVVADSDMPPFDKSRMDGYACRQSDLASELHVLETIPAGVVPKHRIEIGQCAKIMTGARLPEGADCVFKVEDTHILGENKVKCNTTSTAEFISYQGEDYTQGTELIAKGTIIRPDHIAIMGEAGMNKVKVAAPLHVGLIATGSELVEPGEPMVQGKIRNTNSNTLMAKAEEMGLIITYYGIVPDSYDNLKSAIQKSFSNHDITIITGGASVGDFDLIPTYIENEAFQIHWTRTGLKPGNPMSFAQKGNKYLIGLSGNPVSSLVQFEYIGKPILYKMMGAQYAPLRMQVPLIDLFYRKDASRYGIIPVKINHNGKAELVRVNSSGHIQSFQAAHALMEIPTDQHTVEPESLVYVRPL